MENPQFIPGEANPVRSRSDINRLIFCIRSALARVTSGIHRPYPPLSLLASISALEL